MQRFKYDVEVTGLKDIDTLLKEVKKIHMIGIGGSGMCPLAEILHTQGYELTGSDNNESDTLQRIRELGIPVTLGQKAENIGDAELVVYTAALLKDNPELCAAKASVPTFERAKLLGAVSRMFRDCIGVCGTHGKTTVTSMLTQSLIMAGLDPSAVIGGKLPLINSNGRVGESQHFVCEACEFVDTFLELSPAVAVILNVDEDHLDYFGSLENIKKSFRKFAEMATKALIVNGDDENTMDAIKGISGKDVITFGEKETNDYYAKHIKPFGKARMEFDVFRNGKLLTHMQLSVPGKHNVYNALAALVAAIYTGAEVGIAAKGIECFQGAGRRFEFLGERNGVTIADDYAHHPAELKVTLEAAKDMGYNKVWAVFQPFTYSRTSMLLEDFAKVLPIADQVVLSEIMGSREVNTYEIYSKDLAEKIPGAVCFQTFDKIADYIVDNAKSGDLVITLGCGDIYKAAKMMLKKYDARMN